jgi:hypothetical protein
VREAHADDAHLKGGLVVGEVLADVEVDLLSATPTAFPVIGQITGDAIRTTEIRFWPSAGRDPDGPSTEPVLTVAGQASRDGETIRFEGSLLLDETWLPNAEPGDRSFLSLIDIRQVRGIPTAFTANEGGSLSVGVDVRKLFASANFAAIRENPTSRTDAEVRLLTQSSGGTGSTDQVMRSLFDALRSIKTYDVRWRAPLARTARRLLRRFLVRPIFRPLSRASSPARGTLPHARDWAFSGALHVSRPRTSLARSFGRCLFRRLRRRKRSRSRRPWRWRRWHGRRDDAAQRRDRSWPWGVLDHRVGRRSRPLGLPLHERHLEER